MKVSRTWLNEYCDPGLTALEIGETLSLSGIELERITRVGVPSADGNASFFRIGRVLSADRHPDAERLSVCKVQLAGSDMRTIVCGAPNVAAGETVLVALPGAVLPDGTKLGRANLRGVVSDGMILSETEVELGADADGIMLLPDSLEIGEPAGTYITLGDDVLEFEISPNRPDCMCVYGIARELHAITSAPLAPAPTEEDTEATGEGKAEDQLSVEVEDFELCPRFSARVFTDVNVGPSPVWLKARLMAVGQRPINNVVDITNYAMLLCGQPMHAYDLDQLAGAALKVRRAREGERIVTLDGEERVLDDDVVLVCDAERASGIGGVMGGADSEVSEATVRVAMEAATWNGPNILETSKKLGLRTEASGILERLGFGTDVRDVDLDVRVPFFRHYDVTREVDLIEEVARVHGLDKLPTTLPARERAVGGLTREQKLRRLVDDTLRGRGLSQIVSYSFVSPEAIASLRLPEEDERMSLLHISNPLSEDRSVMRTTLLSGLLEAARHNLDRDLDELRLFEVGRVFYSKGLERLPDEHLHLGVLLAGTFQPATWRSPEHKPDFYAVKALLVTLLDTLGVDWHLADGGPSFLHPGRAAEVLAGGHEVGWLGELHPLTARAAGIDEAPAAFEIDLDAALAAAAGPAQYVDLSTYPATFQDIAVVVDEAVEARTVVDTVQAAGGAELRGVRVFDLYRGEQLGEGKKSVALRLEFQAADRTLTDEEVGQRREQIKSALARQLDGSLRE